MSVDTLELTDTRRTWVPRGRTGSEFSSIEQLGDVDQGSLFAEPIARPTDQYPSWVLAERRTESLFVLLMSESAHSIQGDSTGPTRIKIVVHFDPTPIHEGFLAGLGIWQASLSRGIVVSELPAPPAREDPPRSSKENDPLQAAEDLREWLDLTYTNLESITGIAKNTIHHWKRTGASARPSTVRKLWRLHALVHALSSQLGQKQAVEWLRAGPESPLDLLLAGDLEAVEARAGRLLFRPPAKPSDQADYAPFRPEEDIDEQTGQPATSPLRRSGRRPTRGRLSDS